jgi:DNA-binding winged helix-turn-helix (wHTH) protein/tetratricopeptide (TPR) repeat protein
MEVRGPSSEKNLTAGEFRVWAFGEHLLEEAERRLTRRGSALDLTPKAFDLLVFLVERSGRLVTKGELMEGLWPDTFVEDGTLARHVSSLRKALGDDDAAMIETIPKSGYRFCGEVRVVRRPRATRSDEAVRTLAVLPFKDLGSSPDLPLAVGLADTLISRLNTLPDLKVRPVAAVRRYTAPDQDPLAAGRDLKVEAVLDGTLQRDGDRLRLSARLLRASDGEALWARTFEDTFRGVFALQDTLAAQVAATLLPALSADGRRSLSRSESRDPAAYELYLRGRYCWGRRTQDELRRALRYFEEAVSLDPSFAAAHAARADALTLLAGFAVPSSEALEESRASAERALALDPGCADAHAALGLIAQKGDWARAEREYEAALRLQPDHPTALQRHGELLALLGRFEEGIALLKRARQVDPVSPIVGSDLAKALVYARRYDEAVAEGRAVLQADPTYARARLYLGLALLLRGDRDEGLAEVRAFAEPDPSPYALGVLACAHGLAGQPEPARALGRRLDERARSEFVTPYALALAHVGAGEVEEALGQLESLADGRQGLFGLAVSPLLDPLRGEPRFTLLMSRAGLPLLPPVASGTAAAPDRRAPETSRGGSTPASPRTPGPLAHAVGVASIVYLALALLVWYLRPAAAATMLAPLAAVTGVLLLVLAAALRRSR